MIRGYRGPVTNTERESELLSVTLQLLQERGYEGLTVDEVAAAARAGKATVDRRWPSRAALVLAAFIEGVSAEPGPAWRHAAAVVRSAQGDDEEGAQAGRRPR